MKRTRSSCQGTQPRVFDLDFDASYATARLDVTTVALRRARPDEAGMVSDLALDAKGFWGYDKAFIESCRGELTLGPDDVAHRHFVVADLGGRVVGFL